jgi:cell division protein FtsL
LIGWAAPVSLGRSDKKMYKLTTLAIARASLLALRANAIAAEPGEEIGQLKQMIHQQSQQLDQLKQSLAEQERQSKQDREALEAQKVQLEALQRQVESHGADLNRRFAQPDAALELYAGRGAAGDGTASETSVPQQNPIAQNQQAPTNQSPQPAPPTQQPAGQQPQTQQAPTVGQAPEKPKETKPPEVAPIFQQPGVLTPKAKLVLEPSFQYAYSTSNRVSVIGFEVFPAILIGVLDIRAANTSSYTLQLAARYGVTNRFEFEAKVPYLYRSEDLQTREFLNASFVDSQFSSTGHGFGDLEFTGRYQFNDGGMEKPYYIGSLRLKTRTGTDPFQVDRDPTLPRGSGRLLEQPTGTGFYSLQPGLTVIYPTDPAVFFGSLNYLWNIKRNNVNVNNQGFADVDPGDGVGFNFGMGLALNERASFSIGYEHNIFGKTRVNGQVAAGELTTQLGTLLLGYSYKLKSKANLNLSLGIGVTKDAPDVQLNVRLPMPVN